MNLANNHAYDFGPSAQRETVAALTRVGVRNTGRPGTMAVQRVDGQRVAVLGFASYDWADPLLDIPAARRRVQEAARVAEIVIVTFHGGGGYEVFGLNPTTATSMVLQVTLSPDGRLQRARIRPTQLVGNGTPAPGGDAIAMVRELSRDDFGARAPRIGAGGVVTPPRSS
jgi:hypothetical protein